MQFVTDKLVTVSLFIIASLADNVRLTVKLLMTESSTLAVTVKFSIKAFTINALFTDNVPLTDSLTTDKLLTQRLSIQLATTKSVTERVPSIVTFFLNFADLSTFNLP